MTMKKFLVMLAMLGVVVSCFMVRSQWVTRKSEDAYELVCAFSSASHTATLLSALERIRKGETNRAIQSLEIALDGSFVYLEDYSKRVEKPDTNIVKILRRAEEYRAKYSRVVSERPSEPESK